MGGNTWGRIWFDNADQATGTECAGCHGSFATGWTTNAGTLVRPDMTSVSGPGALTATHASNWDGDANADEVSPTSYHSVCKSCHGMNSAADKNPNYAVSAGATPLWNKAGFPSDHGNGSVTINGPSADENGQTAAGAEYNANNDTTLETSDYGCTKACHQGAGNVNHNMGNSSWPVQYRDFGAGDCDGCHGYPPVDNMTGKGIVGNYQYAALEDYTGGGAGHDALDHVAPTVVRSNAWTPCLPCHPDTSHGLGGTTVTRANVQVTMQAAYNAKSGAASFTAGALPTAATCANVSCHGGQSDAVLERRRRSPWRRSARRATPRKRLRARRRRRSGTAPGRACTRGPAR